MIGKKKGDGGVIIGLEGNVWARSESMNITTEEAIQLTSVMKSNDYSTFIENGIIIGGVKYNVIDSLVSSHIAAVSEDKTSGISCSITSLCVVLSHWKEGNETDSHYNLDATRCCAQYISEAGY